jgi:beta-galactosidase
MGCGILNGIRRQTKRRQIFSPMILIVLIGSNIPVPADWQFHTDDFPLYSNIVYPYEINPPFMPKDYNPVGCYARTFTIPENWDKHQVFLHFAGVNSAFYVWVNGQKVGYSEGSKTPAEFDISSYLLVGDNQLAVQVIRWSDGTYLEGSRFLAP